MGRSPVVRRAAIASIAFGLVVVAACSMPAAAGIDSTVPDASFPPLGITTCPCEVSEPSLVYVLGCHSDACISVGGQPKGYHCLRDGLHEDDGVCDGGLTGTCVPKTCATLGSTCGEARSGCERSAALECGSCGDTQFCNADLDRSDFGPYRCFPIAQNLVIFGNQGGGLFTIDVDEDIPGLAIALTSAETMDVTITGTYAANVAFVWFTGDAEASINNVPNTFVTQSAYPGCESPSPGCGAVADVVSAIEADTQTYNLVFNRCQDEAFTGTIKVSDHGSCP